MGVVCEACHDGRLSPDILRRLTIRDKSATANKRNQTRKPCDETGSPLTSDDLNGQVSCQVIGVERTGETLDSGKHIIFI